MKIIIRILITGFIGLIIISCKSEKAKTISRSVFYTDSIYSESLAEYRKHNVYLPRGFEREKKYPILYSTDGNEIIENNFYKTTLDSLIDNQIIKPIILIVSHSNKKIADSTSQKRGDGSKSYLQFRNFEYINDYASTTKDSLLAGRFKNHMQYFNNELISFVENELGQNPNRNDRYFFGVSNGAGFGLSLLNNHPERIGTYLCFSTFGGDIQSNVWKKNINYPKLYLEYGNEEPFFLKEDANFLNSKYKELGLFAEINEFNGGHDYKKWNEKFIEIISKIFTTK